MKIIRIISLSLAGIIIIALVVAAFLPESLRVERSILIERPVEQVFGQVADLSNWQAWNPWSEMDPEAENTISTPSRGVGAKWSWKGDEIGSGQLVEEELQENKMVRFTLTFQEPFESAATDLWQFESQDGTSTRVTWIDEMQLEYPVGRLSGLFLKPMLEEQFDRGLNNLKQVVERQPLPASPQADSLRQATPPAQ